MKLPGKLYLKRDNLAGVGILPTILLKAQESPKEGYIPYVPASEAEALRERVKELEGALRNAQLRIAGGTENGGVFWRENLMADISEALGGGEDKV